MEKARDLDPLSLIINHNVGWMAWYTRQFDRAMVAYRQTLDLDATFANAYNSLGQALTLKGRYADGIAALEKANDLAGGPRSLLAHWATHGLCPAIGREHARCSPSCSSELNRVMCPGIG